MKFIDRAILGLEAADEYAVDIMLATAAKTAQDIVFYGETNAQMAGLDRINDLAGCSAKDRLFAVSEPLCRMAHEKNVRITRFDLDRSSPPAAEHWLILPPASRQERQKRLCFVGPESSGKSYLAREMAGLFGGPHMPEFGREYENYRAKGPYKPLELQEITLTHQAMRAALSPHAGPVLFEDTDALLTAVWAEMLLGKSLPALEEQIEFADHYMLLAPDHEWEDDPVRYFSTPKERMKFYDLTQAKLDKYGLPYSYIGGSWERRSHKARIGVEKLIREWGLSDVF